MFVETFTLLCVLLTIHVVLHRIFFAYGKQTPKLVLVYAAGIIPLLWLIATTPRQQGLVVSSAIFYLFISTLICYWYVSLFVNHETPASMILSSFVKRKHQTIAQIRRLFTKKGLIDDRLGDLVKTRLIRVKGRIVSVTRWGRYMSGIERLYRYILHGQSHKDEIWIR